MNKNTSPKMKLLFYIPGLVDGGAERVVASLASQFAAQNHEVMLAVDFRVKQNGPPLDAAVKLIELPGGHGASIRQLASILATQQPDIALSAIAANNFKLVAASLLSRLSRRADKSKRSKLVLTYHGFEEYKSGWMSWLGYVTLPLISRIAASVVAVSSSLRSELKTRWKAKSANLTRIYNPVSLPDGADKTTLQMDAEQLEARENIILGVGRLVADKRFDLVIEAFARLSTPSAHLIILGEGPERSNLEALIDKKGLSDRVEMPGFTNKTGAYYAKAKCFVLASRKESFGMVLVEALGFGLPVLATDCGGPREVLDDGRYGILLGIEPTPDELAAAMDKALENPGDPLSRIERAKDFDMKTGLQQYEELFEKITRDN